MNKPPKCWRELRNKDTGKRDRNRNRQQGIQSDKVIKSFSDTQTCEERASAHPDQIKHYHF